MILIALEFEKESMRIAFDSIKERKLRSFLTMLGIIIGISAVISLVSVGEGMNRFITGQLGGFGADKLLIGPQQQGGGFTGPPSVPQQLEDKDIEEIRKVRGIDLAAPLLIKTLQVEFRDEKAQLAVFGIEPISAEKVFRDVQGFELEEGRFPRTGEKNFILLGPVTANSVFSKEIRLGNKVDIGGKEFKVIGIFKETGQQSNDQGAILDLEVLRDLTNSHDQITYAIAKVNDINRIEDIASNVQKVLDDNHGEKRFTVFTTQQLVENISAIFTGLSVLLAGIAGIALVVAGIGIANTMFMSVVERTRVIGIMKAIGATKRNIYEIFLMEAGLIGFFGGLLGAVIGIGLSQVVGIAARSFGLDVVTVVTPELFFGGIGFSVAIAVFFGFLPARRASKLSPIEALRYE